MAHGGGSVVAVGGQVSGNFSTGGSTEAAGAACLVHCEGGHISLAHGTLTLNTWRLHIKEMRGKEETFRMSPVGIGQRSGGGKKKLRETLYGNCF